MWGGRPLDIRDNGDGTNSLMSSLRHIGTAPVVVESRHALHCQSISEAKAALEAFKKGVSYVGPKGTCTCGHPERLSKGLVPARPLGASWCGAHDMCGNVWELSDEGTIMGGSFSSESFPPLLTGATNMHRSETPTSSDVGFRVALSA